MKECLSSADRRQFLALGLVGAFIQHLCGQFSYREHRDGVDDQADHRIDDGNGAPGLGATTERLHHSDGGHLDQQARPEREHEADGAHLHALLGVLGDQRGQRGVGDVVGGEEDRVQQHVGDEEPGVHREVTQARRNREDGDEHRRAAEVRPEHPRPGLAHLGVRLVDQRRRR